MVSGSRSGQKVGKRKQASWTRRQHKHNEMKSVGGMAEKRLISMTEIETLKERRQKMGRCLLRLTNRLTV